MSGGRDFHSKAFDEGTQAKLRLFAAYLTEWLPVFLLRGDRGKITIADFFAGPGKDVSGVSGSPLIAIETIQRFAKQIRLRGQPVYLLLNERSRGKAASLTRVLNGRNIPTDLCRWSVDHLCFEDAFEKHYGSLQGGANLLFFDQSGVKFISDSVYSQIASLARTDFIFFIASSSLRRFADHPYFSKHLNFPRGAMPAGKFNDTHRQVTSYYRSRIPKGKEYYLGAFSIKKGSNIYGLIFGSGHPLGIEKFLRVCWKEDPMRGEANFDIDDEKIDLRSPRLFSEMDKPKKHDVFVRDLRRGVLAGELTTDRDVYLFCLQEGFLPNHGRSVLSEMLREEAIAMRSPGLRPRVSKLGYKDPRAWTACHVRKTT